MSSLTAGEGTVVVEGDASGFAQYIAAGVHQFSSDEPPAAGGSETGPTPYQLLLAALGSCTSMTVALYARRKQWPLKRVRVRLAHSKIWAYDCAHCETHEGRLDRIEREIELDGDLSADQRQRLVEIAEKCPVHRTLRSEIDIVTRLSGPTDHIGDTKAVSTPSRHQHSPEEERRIREAALDMTIAASFPASDPPSTLPNPDDDDAADQ